MDIDEVESTGPNLETVLFANGVEVIRSTDTQIWLSAMAQLTGSPPPSSRDGKSETPQKEDQNAQSVRTVHVDDVSPLLKFSQELGIDLEYLEAAAGPTTDEPYLYLDAKFWEALKSRDGFGRTSPVILVATLLLLWERHAKFGDIDLKMCGKVLSNIGLTTQNASRSFANCDWILVRGKFFKLNPLSISKAEALARAYCLGRS